LGILNAVLIPPSALVFIWLGLLIFTDLWKIETDAPVAQAEYGDATPQ